MSEAERDTVQTDNGTNSTQSDTKTENPETKPQFGKSASDDGKYWQMKYESLRQDYNHLQKINQGLEDKLLNVVETFEKKKEDLISNIEHEKSTLMADVNKLSTKLVDARMKLHDYEEKEILHASECKSPCHKDYNGGTIKQIDVTKLSLQMNHDPNLV